MQAWSFDLWVGDPTRRRKPIANVGVRVNSNCRDLFSPLIRNWFLERPRFHVHFTPTYASWLSLVERWFAELTTKQIRRGAFRSVPQLKAAIQAFIDAHQANLKPFVWTKTADEILASIARFAERTANARAAQLLSRTIVTGHYGAERRSRFDEGARL